MSTALSQPFDLDDAGQSRQQSQSSRHLQSVADDQLTIDLLQKPLATEIRQAARIAQTVADPTEEFQPAKYLHLRGSQSNVVRLQHNRTNPIEDRRHRQQLASIKKMTQTIGAAFIEAELGIRPVMQLSSWVELELFQKLRTRVEHSVNGKYLAVRRGAEGSKKIPAIVPIGVRAAVQANGDWETSMTIRVGQRSRAVAMRLQLHRHRWRVIAFEIG